MRPSLATAKAKLIVRPPHERRIPFIEKGQAFETVQRPTRSEVLPDGTIIETVRDPANPEEFQLLVFKGYSAPIVDEFEHGGNPVSAYGGTEFKKPIPRSEGRSDGDTMGMRNRDVVKTFGYPTSSHRDKPFCFSKCNRADRGM